MSINAGVPLGFIFGPMPFLLCRLMNFLMMPSIILLSSVSRLDLGLYCGLNLFHEAFLFFRLSFISMNTLFNFSRGSTCCSNKLHDFSVIIPKFHENVYFFVFGFFRGVGGRGGSTARL